MLKSSGCFLYENRRLTVSHYESALLKFFKYNLVGAFQNAYKGDFDENACVLVGSFVGNGLYFCSE